MGKRTKTTLVIGAVIILLSSLAGAVYTVFNKKKSAPVVGEIGKIFFADIDPEHISRTEIRTMYADNELLLVTDSNTDYSEVEKLVGNYDAEIVGWIEKTGDYQIRFSEAYTEEELMAKASELEKNELIISAYINAIVVSAPTSDDSFSTVNVGDEWRSDLKNSTDCKGKSWGLEAINAPAAWSILNENQDKINPVRVGVIDEGFDESHDDLKFAEVFYNKTSAEKKSHGTHVAGIMAARSDNNEGICGVYPYGMYNNNSNLYVASVYGADEYLNKADSIMRLKCYLAELILRNVKVINYSMGWDYDVEIEVFGRKEYIQYVEGLSLSVADFLDRFIEKGYDFIIVSGANNHANAEFVKMKKDEKGKYYASSDGDIYEVYADLMLPLLKYVKIDDQQENVNGSQIYKSTDNIDSKYASCFNSIDSSEYPEVYKRIIVVGALNNRMNPSNFSNKGARTDIYAPGGQNGIIEELFPSGRKILSALPNSTYGYANGTSMAAPHVSGVAAMVWSLNNDLTGADVKRILMDNTNSRCTTVKMVDAEAAVRAALNYVPGSKQQVYESSAVPENGVVSSIVVEKGYESNKIEGAAVFAASKNGDPYSTMTDNLGHFELILPEGEYDIVISKPGYRDYIWKDIKIKNEDADFLPDFTRLEPVFKWVVEPSVEADDIISADAEYITSEYSMTSQEYNHALSNYALIKKGGKYGIIDYAGNYSAPVDFDYGGILYTGDISVHNNGQEIKSVIISSNGTIKKDIPAGLGYIGTAYYYDGDSVFWYGSGTGAFTNDYNVAVQYGEKGDYNAINVSKEYGIADKNGLVVPIEYDDAYMHTGNSIIALKKNGVWTFFNKEGKSILTDCEPFPSNQYSSDPWGEHGLLSAPPYPYAPTGGYIPAKIGGKCGYYDVEGNEVIPCGTFEDVRPVHNDLAWVKRNGKWGVISISGEGMPDRSEKKEITENEFSMAEYAGCYSAKDCNIVLELAYDNDIASIDITFTNPTGTRVSQNHYEGTVTDNHLTFTADDGFGINSFTLDFEDGTIILNANCIECTTGIWTIPELTDIVLVSK